MRWPAIFSIYAVVFSLLIAVTIAWNVIHFGRDRNSLVSSLRGCENRTALCPFKDLHIDRSADGAFTGFQIALRSGMGGVIFDSYRLGESANSDVTSKQSRLPIERFIRAKGPDPTGYRRVDVIGYSDLFAAKRKSENCAVELPPGLQDTVLMPLADQSPDSCLARLRAIEFATMLRAALKLRSGDEENILFSTHQVGKTGGHALDDLLNEAFDISRLRDQLFAQARVDLKIPHEQALARTEFERWLDERRTKYEGRLRPLRGAAAQITECYTERCAEQ